MPLEITYNLCVVARTNLNNFGALIAKSLHNNNSIEWGVRRGGVSVYNNSDGKIYIELCLIRVNRVGRIR